MAGRLWTLGPHNHGLGRLWRFRDRRLERAYRTQCDASCVQYVLVHTIGMTVVSGTTSAYYIGSRVTMALCLFLGMAATSVALALLMALSTVAKRHAVPIHAAYCCAMVAIAGALVHVQYIAYMVDVTSTWPTGLSQTTLAPMEAYASWLAGYHSYVSAAVWAASQWIVMSATGLNVWSTWTFCFSFVIFNACILAVPSQGVGALYNVMFVTACCVVLVSICLLLERLRRSNFLAQTQLAQELQASQLADSILNHTLKNILADVAANLEVFLAGSGETALLVDCIACLRRGMQHCKERQVYLKLAAGEYQPVPTPVRLPGLAYQLVAGRPIAVQVPDLEVLLDATLMALILDNAISNAFRHGSPENPDVRFSITEFTPEAGNDEQDSSDGRGQRHLQFIISNAAHSQRPLLTPEDVADLFQRKGGVQPEAADGVSFHIGLTHCVLAAKCGGIALALRQEGDRVIFTASLAAREATSPDEMTGGCPAPPFARPTPSGLCFCCIDDSPAAQRLLAHHIQCSFPDAVVHCFGASEEDIAGFLATALAEADIVILDQHLEFEDKMTHGTDLVLQLTAAGYPGLVCIRSANDSAQDRAQYAASGAHCVLGKDVLGGRMMEELAVAHAKHVALGGAPAPSRCRATAPMPALSVMDSASSPLTSPATSASSAAGRHRELVERVAGLELLSVDQLIGSPTAAGHPHQEGHFGVRSLPGQVPRRLHI